jgi:hypothetical protein
MTSEEVAAAGLSPNRDEVHGSEDIHVRESDLGNASAHDSETSEEGEVRSEGEDLRDVDADPRDLVAARRSKSMPASFVFGESKVTTNLIREYEAAGYFPAGDGRAPLDEQVPTPSPGEVVVFRDFFTCGLRFPCDPMLIAILDKFSVKIHQLLPNSFLELSKFFWIMKTFRCNFSTDVFARLFEVVIGRESLNLAMANTTNLIIADVLSTHADRIREGDLREFRLFLVARQTSLKIGILTSSM